MKIEDAIKKLDENIPHPDNKMVDIEHLPIAIAWLTVKEYIEQARKETTKEILQVLSQYGDRDEALRRHILYIADEYGVEVDE